jgi:outer membrane protein TolC
MIMKKSIFLFVALIAVNTVFSQRMTLFDCWEMSRENYPLIKGKETLARSTELNIKNIKNNWLPRLAISGQISWQSDVPHVEAGSGMPGVSIPQGPKDQYKMHLDVSQTLYEAGKTEALAQVEEIRGMVDEQNIEVELQTVKQMVTDLFFNVLMIDQQKKQIEQKLEALNSRQKELVSLYKNGVIQQSSVKNIEAEIYLVRQSLVEIEYGTEVLMDNLSTYVGRKLENPVELVVPEAADFLNPPSRPEYQLFQYQKEQLEKNKVLTGRNRLPVLAAFGQVGYGNPGYNMLKDDFDSYYMVGLKLKWTPWDWKETKRKKLVLENHSLLVDYREETFKVNQERAVRQITGEIDRYLKMMDYDERIVNLKKDVVEQSEKHLRNGTITSSDYLMDLDAAIEAEINKEVHKLQYLKGMASRFVAGRDNQN